MIALKLSQIATACNGIFNKDITIDNICIDTRKVTKGSLFICIKGERFDAHNFIDDAFKNGASAVMICEDISVNGPYVKVEDTKSALLVLGGYYRSLFDIPLVGLTGSVGKTTTKEFTYLVVNAKYKSIKTQGNLNNEIGLPQMLFQLDDSVEAAVIEMGMNHFGEISRLAKAAKPTVGVITNIGVSHIENLGSRDGILKAKLEILDGLENNAPLILNADDDKLSTVKCENHKILFYGINNGDFKAKNIIENEGNTYFNIEYFGNVQSIKIPTIGIHNVYNALAAFAVGYVLNIDSNLSADALSSYEPTGMRQKLVKNNGITFIEDCYNASPDSMRAALKTLHDTKGNKKIAVLADMLELGEYSIKAHSEVGKMVADNKIDYLLAYGNEAKYIVEAAKLNGVDNSFLFDDKNVLTDKLISIVDKKDVVIFKGSRGMKLEDVINKLYKELEK